VRDVSDTDYAWDIGWAAGYEAGQREGDAAVAQVAELLHAATEDYMDAVCDRRMSFVMGWGFAMLQLKEHLDRILDGADRFSWSPRKYTGEEMMEMLTKLMRRLWNEMQLPKEYCFWKDQ
jgi:hypothetical protein